MKNVDFDLRGVYKLCVPQFHSVMYGKNLFQVCVCVIQLFLSIIILCRLIVFVTSVYVVLYHVDFK